MSDQLYFYSKSRDVLPGAGKNERVADVAAYSELCVMHWRRVLSNFHVPTNHIQYNGLTYNTIEHVFQATKIAIRDPVVAMQFAIESNSELALSDGAVAQKHRKMVKLNHEELAHWATLKDHVMKDAAIQLYTNPKNELERKILLATRDAELWHIQSRKPAVRFKHLEEIRDDIRKNMVTPMEGCWNTRL